MMGLVWNGACAWTFFISCIISTDVLFIWRQVSAEVVLLRAGGYCMLPIHGRSKLRQLKLTLLSIN